MFFQVPRHHWVRSLKYFSNRSHIGVYATQLPHRCIYSETGVWEKKYKKKTRKNIERYWSEQLALRWKSLKEETSASSKAMNGKPKFYCLSMFPYPSGQLHMGHIRVYTISDAMAHYHRMNGKEVLHPMGWDSFGLPAENAALTRGLDPAEWTKENIAYMKQQMLDLNMFFDWEREISTCSPEYYKWTQYFFLKFFQTGLAYRKKAAVNWDPVDKTVLADEQVDAEGRSWRSGAVVEKKVLEQWFLKTTQYAESLLDSLPQLEENYGIKAMQKNWIGNIDGCYVDFKLTYDSNVCDENLSVFCSHPELLICASHINIQADHLSQITTTMSCDQKTANFHSALTGTEMNTIVNKLVATHPFTGEFLPVIISNHHMETYDKAVAVLGIPSANNQDKVIADSSGLSNNFKTNLSREEALAKMKELKCGTGYLSSSNLQDWLISRQRRWGTPIPVVYCPVHGTVPVPEEELPVMLPSYSEPIENWKQTQCPECGCLSQRETDTMDTFVDSAWYFFRYADPHNCDNAFSKESCDHFLPVDLYIGGKEHAVLHLYYARFFSHFCADLNMTSSREPFKKLLAQGIIRGKTYRVKENGKYLAPDQVEEQGSKLVEVSTGMEVETSFEKMSKSKYNGVDPKEFVALWGISVTRLFVLYAAAPFESIDWDVKTDIIPGVMRWQMKLWTCVTMLIEARKHCAIHDVSSDLENEKGYGNTIAHLAEITDDTIAQVSHHFEESCLLSAAITHLMTIVKVTLNTHKSVIEHSPEYERAVCAQVIMSAPLVPHFASELWEGLCSMKYKLTDQDWNNGVLDQRWPSTKMNACIKNVKTI